MDQYLNSPECASTEEEPWYYSDDVLEKMRQKVEDCMKASVNTCFLIAAIENKKFKGATLYFYLYGILQTEDFKPPFMEVKTGDLKSLSEVKKHTGK
ncbi:hypothetical protein OYC64_001349 [Pagothenia borchgrevinki]|uniref:SNTX thioredoxin-like domain-containing protein n=1 Tax=Pagothenia borchgrevinki TaxID=8213 RepID=A0ABD2GB87_PAGBO